ncbi:DUF7344 domain-containing protein [Natronobeatus ordinarius]|uniref:DUF7344 domain-containing protein n=1 Tax=Natronobeatus ordinarius TaxID=2963433 RepID=UPI0020CD9E70|nr:hypothetical protein [Natronobeatus ordinarius]
MSSEFGLPDDFDEADRSTPRVVDLFDALSSTRRCVVVEVLSDRSPLAEADLAARVLERGVETDASRERVHVSLRHQHLPRLATAGIVDHDPETGIVDCGRFFDVADATLEETWARCKA